MEHPGDDEIEVTLLGRGVGESVVVHLPGHEWLVVDSFIDYQTKLPVAQWYLESLGASNDSVKTIVVTHFHADHYRGIDALHDYYRSARLMITDALGRERFLALYGDKGGILGGLPGTIKRAHERLIGRVTPGLRHLKTGALVAQRQEVQVMALSPTEAAVLQSNLELASAMATNSRPTVQTKLRDDNRCSVVLYVRVGQIKALLGADLIADAPAYGWSALLDEPLCADLDPVDLIKIPHHGGVSAHDEEMWNRLVGAGPVLKVAPYWPSAIPWDTDIDRLRARGVVWQAAPSVGYETDEFGNEVSIAPQTGIIQARRAVTEDAWRVVAIPPAFPCA